MNSLSQIVCGVTLVIVGISMVAGPVGKWLEALDLRMPFARETPFASLPDRPMPIAKGTPIYIDGPGLPGGLVSGRTYFAQADSEGANVVIGGTSPKQDNVILATEYAQIRERRPIEITLPTKEPDAKTSRLIPNQTDRAMIVDGRWVILPGNMALFEGHRLIEITPCEGHGK